MNVEIKGAVVTKLNELFESESGFKKQRIQVKTEGEYSQVLELEFINDKVELLDLVNEGCKIEAKANLRGRTWTNPNGKELVFMSLAVWSLKVL